MAQQLPIRPSPRARPDTEMPNVLPSLAPPAPPSASASTAPPDGVNQEPERKAKKSEGKKSKKPKLDAGQTRMFQSHLVFRAYTRDHLSPEDEAEMGVTAVPLDLRSGDVLDTGPRFIEPVPREEMAAFVERTQPWKKYPLGPTPDDEKPEKMKGEPWADDFTFHAGEFMFYSLETFAQGGSSYYFNRDWRNVWGPKPQLGLLRFWSSGDDRRWYVDGTMEIRKGNRPHVHVFMHGFAPFQEDTVNAGEMAVASGLIAARRWYDKMNNHRYIPVTVFSAWGRKLRILQVWHDKKEPRALHVRRSRIMDFEEGEKANREDWIAVLCWMMGKPVGEEVEDEAGKTGKSVAGQAGEEDRAKDGEGVDAQPPNDETKSAQETRDRSNRHRAESDVSDIRLTSDKASEGARTSHADLDESMSDAAEQEWVIVHTETDVAEEGWVIV